MECPQVTRPFFISVRPDIPYACIVPFNLPSWYSGILFMKKGYEQRNAFTTDNT